MHLVRIVKNHLVFHPTPPMRAIFPEMKEGVLDGELIAAVPHTLEAARVLRNLGYGAPSPIRTGYDWPLRPGRTPGDWQIDTAEFLTLNPRAHCHNAMRSRKTGSTLWAIDYLQRTKVVSKALVVAPISSMELAWGDSIFMDFPRKKFAVLYGSAQKRRKLLDTDQDIYIINHDGVEVILDDLMRRTDINLIVVDELHEYFNTQTNRWKYLNKFINHRGVECWAWGLTGTPSPEGKPTHAFGQSKLITPENIRNKFTGFKNEVMMQIGPFKWVPRKGSDDIVKRALSPSIRFERSVVTSMEPCLIERHAELSEQQKKHMNELLRQATTEIDGTQVTAINAAVLIQKIVQAACGVVYGAAGEFLRIDFGPRLKVLEELIEQNDEKVLVFVPFTGALEAVAGELRKRWSVEIVDGSVSAGRRDQIFKNFQNTKDPHIIVAHPATMSYSLELTAASLVIWYAPYPAGKTYEQACARIDGGGQKVKMDIAHISATPAERKIFSALREKGRLQDVVLELLKSNQKRS